jgi:cytochrome c oxidase subunit 1
MQAATPIPTDVSYLEYKGKYKGIFSWIFSTDHKRIALLYLYSMMVMFLVGVLLGLAMKLELIAPGKTIMEAKDYNAVFTVHGVIMIFMIVVPDFRQYLATFVTYHDWGKRRGHFPS